VTRSSLLRSVAPGIANLSAYRREWLPGDVVASVTVAAYLVPQVLAYATIAGLPPVTGLWATLPTLAVYALLGTSRLLSVGPESTTALMTATVVGPLQRWLPAAPAPLLAVLLATAAVPLLRLEDHGIKVIGAIPSGLPVPALPPLEDLTGLALPALGLLLVGDTPTTSSPPGRSPATAASEGARCPGTISTPIRSSSRSASPMSAPDSSTGFRSAAVAAAPLSPTHSANRGRRVRTMARRARELMNPRSGPIGPSG